jgi:hypothetical protein
MISILAHFLYKILKIHLKYKQLLEAAYNHQYYAIYKIALHISIHQQKTRATLVMLCILFLTYSLITSNLYPKKWLCNDTEKPTDRILQSLSCTCVNVICLGAGVQKSWVPGHLGN